MVLQYKQCTSNSFNH